VDTVAELVELQGDAKKNWAVLVYPFFVCIFHVFFHFPAHISVTAYLAFRRVLQSGSLHFTVWAYILYVDTVAELVELQGDAKKNWAIVSQS